MNPLTSIYPQAEDQLQIEIQTYLSYISLTSSEIKAYNTSFETLKKCIIKFYSASRVFLTGSLASNLAFYGADLDFTVTNIKIGDVYKALKNETMCEFINCSHPIVKGTIHNIKFDVSHSGIQVLNDVENNKNLPILIKNLIQILRQIMRSQSIDKLREGGMSSYLLIQLIKAFISEKQQSEDLSTLLKKFLKFYGCKFDCKVQQIQDGRIQDRNYIFQPLKQFPERRAPDIVIIVGKIEIGGSITNWDKIQQTFKTCYNNLKIKSGNILSSIITIDQDAEDLRSKMQKSGSKEDEK
ncbi:DNA polymerase sigma family protein [Spironucleus salmonicida]|uniref:DNA polymerase sigma family protein n=1 Tax=Spironucleus salmonicida TaxID=348837 RepID=V6M702_9EUKA|nr:DNA polymerase sigma family protein [Spironucleus salmonicida]|eukprot:EST49189.1 hypothetical protein SS50377_10405 [Spironucleus salmonicida]